MLEERKKRIQKILPQLIDLREKRSEKTGVTYFEGKKGVIKILNDIFDGKGELIFFGSLKTAMTSLKHYPESFADKIAEKAALEFFETKVRPIVAEHWSPRPSIAWGRPAAGWSRARSSNSSSLVVCAFRGGRSCTPQTRLRQLPTNGRLRLC